MIGYDNLNFWDGLHFRVSDPYRLAATLRRAASNPALWQTLQTTLRPPSSLAKCVARHVERYQALLA